MSGEDYTLTPKSCPQGFIYEVKKGDTLYLIAKEFGIPLNTLLSANPQIKDSAIIYPGQKICIPLPGPPGALGACALVLNPQEPDITGGVLWLRTLNGRTSLFVAGIGLPPPTNYSETSYTAIFNWNRTVYELPLHEFTSGVWVGFNVEEFPPEFFSEGVIDVFPGPVLSGRVKECN